MLNGDKKKSFKLDNIEDLEIIIDVIGYRRQGEAIIILFRDVKKNVILHSIAVDCYSIKHKGSERNWSDDILRKHKVKSLSTICWTHPHMDHSKGLLKLFHKYCRTSTKIIKPAYFDNLASDVIVVNDKDTKQVVEDLFSLNALRRKSIVSALVPGGAYTEVEHFLLCSNNSRPKDVSLNLLTPVGSILDDYHKNNRILEDLNGISVAFIINIDDYYFFFGGDTTNEHIDEIDRQYIRDCKFVKIPHHASRTAEKVGDYVEMQNLVTACTTTYKTSLPHQDVLKKYTDKCGYVFTTGYKETNNLKTYFGIVEYVYKFTSPNITLDVNLYGNAHQV